MIRRESARTPHEAMDSTTTTTRLALLADEQARFRTLSHQIMHSEDLLADLDTSMRRLVDYLPVVEQARRELCARREGIVAELWELVMELLGMHDMPRHDARDFREESVGGDMAAGPYELDGTSCSGHIVVEGQATKAGACVGDAVMATLADPVAAPPICAEFPSGRSSSGTIAGLKRVDSASPTTCCRKAAPLMVDSKLADETATASNLNNRHAGQDRTSPSFVELGSGGRYPVSVSLVQSRGSESAKKARSSSRFPESIKRLRGTVKPPFFRPSGGAVY
ncbi:hypothetical protein LTR32_004156 [Rachicladosporium monterosium]|uniref:Inhibitor of growth protein N-terminal histone-binding domain-containing protein n=1 Tax=Rachicladosporium monterosium TaxID=1507873 RepID=A0ABR0L6Q6_9PEZI|nr:hypothetical protein LTR32_004156 [Rachicladosporium monterosium]